MEKFEEESKEYEKYSLGILIGVLSLAGFIIVELLRMLESQKSNKVYFDYKISVKKKSAKLVIDHKSSIPILFFIKTEIVQNGKVISTKFHRVEKPFLGRAEIQYDIGKVKVGSQLKITGYSMKHYSNNVDETKILYNGILRKNSFLSY